MSAERIFFRFLFPGTIELSQEPILKKKFKIGIITKFWCKRKEKDMKGGL